MTEAAPPPHLRGHEGIAIPIEVTNEARVHLWYEQHFGYGIHPYRSVEEAIGSWPTTATSVGVRYDEIGAFVVRAPYGLDDLFGLIVRPNTRQITKDIYLAKTRRWLDAWPKLTVIPWDS